MSYQMKWPIKKRSADRNTRETHNGLQLNENKSPWKSCSFLYIRQHNEIWLYEKRPVKFMHEFQQQQGNASQSQFSCQMQKKSHLSDHALSGAHRKKTLELM